MRIPLFATIILTGMLAATLSHAEENQPPDASVSAGCETSGVVQQPATSQQNPASQQDDFGTEYENTEYENEVELRS